MVEKRGRKSLGDLSLVAMDPQHGRPEPPEDLNRTERELWKRTADAMPRGWFSSETHELLHGLCRHSFAARTLGARYEALLVEGPPAVSAELYWESLDKLGGLYDRETRAICTLASKLRVAKMQRQRNAEVEIRNTAKRRMWEE